MARFKDVSTVVSLMPIPIREQKPGLIPNEFVMKACKDPLKDCEVLLIERAKFPVYIDENRPSLIVPAPSDQVAESICRDYKIGLSHFEPGKSEPGIFWVKGEWNRSDILEAETLALEKGSKREDYIIIAEELSRARTMMLEFFKNLVNEADDTWQQYHMRRAISSLQRQAAKCLRLEKEWDTETQINESMSRCKYCMETVDVEAIVCRSCGGVLNVARYEKEFVRADRATK